MVCGDDRLDKAYNASALPTPNNYYDAGTGAYSSSRVWSRNNTCGGEICDVKPVFFDDSHYDVVVLPKVSIQVMDVRGSGISLTGSSSSSAQRLQKKQQFL